MSSVLYACAFVGECRLCLPIRLCMSVRTGVSTCRSKEAAVAGPLSFSPWKLSKPSDNQRGGSPTCFCNTDTFVEPRIFHSRGALEEAALPVDQRDGVGGDDDSTACNINRKQKLLCACEIKSILQICTVLIKGKIRISKSK